MALFTLTALGIVSGLAYGKYRKHYPKKPSSTTIRSRVTRVVSSFDAQKKSLQILTSDNGVVSDQANKHKSLREKIRDNKTLAIYLGSSGVAITGSLLFPPHMILSVPGAVYLLRDVYINTYKTIAQKNPLGVDPLMAIFSTGMLLKGYFVIAHFYISLYLLCRFLLDRVKSESKKNIVDVFRDQPSTVWLLVDGVEIETSVDAVTKNAIAIVRSGESVPVDGVVVEGVATVDQQMLTGESQPVEKHVGDKVFSCTVVLTGSMQVQVEKTGEETASARIGQILNSTSDIKTKRQLSAERFTEKTVLPTLVLGGLALVTSGSTAAIVMINSHFRYRLTLATSTSALTYLNLAAQRGLLLKSGLILENIQSVDTVVFDKTGT